MENTVLVLAPTGRDAALISSSLKRAGICAVVCPTLEALCENLLSGANAAVIAEEALSPTNLSLLSQELAKQPHWSDFPLVVLSLEGANRAESGWQIIGVAESIGNATILERPFHEITLLSAVRVALRARAKQYQVRDYLQERLSIEEALRESENRLRLQAEELDQRVRQRTSELVAANSELEGFTYSIAHDLRSPLRRLMFSSQIILSDYAESLDAEGKLTLTQLSDEAKKLSLLVDDLLQYARLGQTPVKARTVEVSKIASKVIEEMELDQRITLCIEPGISVRADPALLELVLRNLIDNACKYRTESSEPKIWIGYDPDEKAVFVKDNGIGFNMEFSRKVFQPFERLHRDADYPGSGIGLANVKRIVERHGGRVWARSEEGEGATFYIVLSG